MGSHDIAEAISAHQKAVKLTPQGHAELPVALTNLGNSFHCRFERTGELSDIAEAISLQRKAVDITPYLAFSATSDSHSPFASCEAAHSPTFLMPYRYSTRR